MVTDYSKKFDNLAIYLPAINSAYATFCIKPNDAGLSPMTPCDLNFLSKSTKLFYYPWVLYSAGQGAKTRNDAQKDNIVRQRNRDETIVIADSGGFQVAQGTIEFEGKQTTRRLFEWMKEHGTYCIALDFPIAGIDAGRMRPHIRRLLGNGIDIKALAHKNDFSAEYNACLHQTKINNDVFYKDNKHNGKAKILNVLQGRNESECKFWFDAVNSHLFHGWSFAGSAKDNFAILLRRIIEMRDQKILERAEAFHFLGKASLDIPCLYTTVKRCIEKVTGKSIVVTYDGSSPFQSAGRKNIMLGCVQAQQRSTFFDINIRKIDRIKYRDRTLGELVHDYSASRDGVVPFISDISKFVTLSQVFQNLNDENPKLSLAGNMILNNHNVQVFIESHLAIQRNFHADNGNILSVNSPRALISASELIEDVFKSEKPFSRIREVEKILDFS